MALNKVEVLASRKFADYKTLLKKEALSWLKKRDESNRYLEVEIVTKSEIKRLNKKYLKHDCPTDVLSFPLDKIPGEQISNVGTVVICGDIIEERTRQTNKTFKGEIVFVLRHGINHLLGIHHK